MRKLNKIVQNIVLIIAMLNLTLSCNSQTQNTNLENILKECKKYPSKKCEKLFFDNFPKSFQEFQKVYGFDDVKGEAQYYSNSEEHLLFFFKSFEGIKKEDFINRLINISRGGKWDADSVNSFQDKFRTYFFANSLLFINLLKGRNENEIKDFWYFFSDGPEFNNEVSEKVLKVLEKEPQMKNLYQNVIIKVKEDNIH